MNKTPAPPPPPPQLLTTYEAAAVLQVSPRTLERWRTVHTVPLPYVRVGTQVRYLRSDIARYVTLHREGGHE